ncbi:IGPS-domain-containing protein [Tilletiaria anomala UBC 951]|uniref:Multifunctional tryptophan biosynthesis protein n=1 Tax=Tilletiaria anomala (strain ATCC 24038 / CBS 436.72 / UBC 951) TaxID=1037660 RepID=A0A066VEK5_TILAU|nr:IGPS-domain-containing protein [Tilletiaria anomala UBC 951]KDN39846.1 IGPS-domain-containing protein [Tilletiaria anomala UBC 951]
MPAPLPAAAEYIAGGVTSSREPLNAASPSTLAPTANGNSSEHATLGADEAYKGKTVLIDNYDSFTYNIVEFLSELGADVIVFRNDKVTVNEIEALRPANIVISPGPGHPLTDSGISIECIKHFAGKIPMMGVCMGLQTIYAAYAGTVEFAGEILHGKTSKIVHDGKGLYAGLDPDGVVGTRYHSLAAQISSLPSELVVTSKTDSGVVMGIRHTRYTVEAMQYHPESILSKGGKEMMRNFLSWKSGTWADCSQALIDAEAIAHAESTKTPIMAMMLTGSQLTSNGSDSENSAKIAPKLETILQRIHAQRLKDIAATKAQPGFSQRDLDIALAMHLAPPQISFPQRLIRNAERRLPGVMAEMKRASPSKGDIDPLAHAGAQAAAYAKGGASVISVLTEPKWFKGTLHDLSLARRAIDSMQDRPAILRKDFIVDTYQIAEARLAGADTVLLIVAMLEDAQLQVLYEYSCSLGMEPLVEVNNLEEMQRALKLGAKVIGVNNRNLHDFKVDMETTSRLASVAEANNVILCALSGISGRADVVKYQKEGVKAVLVGEALMRSSDKKRFIDELLGLTNGIKNSDTSVMQSPLVKICGLQTSESAMTATLAGADFLGFILAPNTKRTVTLAQAADIINVVRSVKGAHDSSKSDVYGKIQTEQAMLSASPWFATAANRLKSHPHRPLIVGVFRDQPLDEIKHVAETLRLDVVQLHGRTESVEWAKFLPGVWVIRVFSVDSNSNAQSASLADVFRPGLHHIAALDSGSGGTGEPFDWSIASTLANVDIVSNIVHGTMPARQPLMLAGGLHAGNVARAIQAARPLIVDTSSGVETEGRKDGTKIREFVEAVKATKILA